MKIENWTAEEALRQLNALNEQATCIAIQIENGGCPDVHWQYRPWFEGIFDVVGRSLEMMIDQMDVIIIQKSKKTTP